MSTKDIIKEIVGTIIADVHTMKDTIYRSGEIYKKEADTVLEEMLNHYRDFCEFHEQGSVTIDFDMTSVKDTFSFVLRKTNKGCVSTYKYRGSGDSAIFEKCDSRGAKVFTIRIDYKVAPFRQIVLWKKAA
jgi:hypothetical protein